MLRQVITICLMANCIQIFAQAQEFKSVEGFDSKPSISGKIFLLDHSKFDVGVQRVVSNSDLRTKTSTSSPDLKNLVFQHYGSSWSYPANEIERIIFQPTELTSFHSLGDGQTVYLDLGSGLDIVPEPPGWNTDLNNHVSWKAAQSVQPGFEWCYISGSDWIWTNGIDANSVAQTILFRRIFQLKNVERVRSAYLEMTADSGIESIYVNGQAVHQKRVSLSGRLLRWNISHILREGNNLLAIRSFNAPTDVYDLAGLSYKIIVETFDRDFNALKNSSPSVVVRMKNGDIIFSQKFKLDLNQLTLTDGQKKIRLQREGVEWVQFNDRVNTTNNFNRTITNFSGGKSSYLNSRSEGLEFGDDSRHRLFKQGYIRDDGQFIAGSIVAASGSQLKVQEGLSSLKTIELKDVKRIELNAPLKRTTNYIHPINEDLVARVRLIDGSVLTGEIESLNAKNIVLIPDFGFTSKIQMKHVSQIQFFQNRDRLFKGMIEKDWPSGSDRSIAIIGGLKSKNRSSRVISLIQQIASEYQLKVDWLSGIDLLDEEKFNSKRFPIVLNVDEKESFYRTIYTENDAQESIIKYVQNGGHLIHCATGAPFQFGIENQNGAWGKSLANDAIGPALEMKFVGLDERDYNLIPFDLPPQPANDLIHEVNSGFKYSRWLPPLINFPSSNESRFRPITSEFLKEQERFIPLYLLKDDRGNEFGVSMAFIRGINDSGNRAYISYPLAQGEVGDKTAIEYLIPTAILAVLER